MGRESATLRNLLTVWGVLVGVRTRKRWGDGRRRTDVFDPVGDVLRDGRGFYSICGTLEDLIEGIECTVHKRIFPSFNKIIFLDYRRREAARQERRDNADEYKMIKHLDRRCEI